jgi:hypothetical protein
MFNPCKVVSATFVCWNHLFTGEMLTESVRSIRILAYMKAVRNTDSRLLAGVLRHVHAIESSVA